MPVAIPSAGRRRARLPLAALAAAAAVAAFASAAHAVPSSFADLAEKVKPAVVNITSEKAAARIAGGAEAPDLPMIPKDSPFREFYERFFGRDFGVEPRQFGRQAPRPAPIVGAGSGFLIDSGGYVVTNHHVVADAERLKVTLEGGEAFDAKLIGSDPRTDLALLKIDAGRELPHLEFGDSDKVRPGDWVLAVGNPFGLGGSVTAGIVSARGRDLPGGQLVDFLQIDAPINPGNSGGPAFDAGGKVIGVNSAIYTPNGGNVGIGFAIPSNIARDVIAALRSDGRVERGWLGVQIQPVTPELAEGFGLGKPRGALVATVEENGPAARGGLKPGDVVLAWGGTEVAQSRDLARLVAATPAGQKVHVKLWRSGKETSALVMTGQMKDQTAEASNQEDRDVPAGSHVVPGTGLAVTDLTVPRRERLGVPDDVTGAVVAGVEPGSPAERSGIRPGDVIRRVGDTPVASADALVSAVAKERNGGRTAVAMMVVRGNDERFVALRFARA
jgi:serine protease Do